MCLYFFIGVIDDDDDLAIAGRP
jgi:hypothetical protein